MQKHQERVIDAGYLHNEQDFGIAVDRVGPSYVGLAYLEGVQFESARPVTKIVTITGRHDDAESAYQECVDAIRARY